MVGHRHALAAWLAAFLAVLLVGLAGADHAHAQAPVKAEARRTPMPLVPRGEGPACVAPTDWMRRYHMVVLNHQRDKTVHLGDRAGNFSLTGCITCHAVKGANGQPVTAADPKHFCRVCHDYAAVTMDCFECHASRPDAPSKGALGLPPSDVAALEGYLKGKKP